MSLKTQKIHSAQFHHSKIAVNFNDLKSTFKLRQLPFELMQQLAKVSKTATPVLLKRIAAEQYQGY